MAASSPPVKGVAFSIRVALEDFSTPGAFKSAPTLAAGDFKVDIDGAGFNNLGTLPTVSPAAGTAVLISLSTSEMNGDVITVRCIDQTSPKEWSDLGLCIQTVAAGWSTAAALATVQADTDDIQTRIPAALTANGNMKSSLVEILTTALTETSGLLAGGFKKFFNIATPTGTVNSLPDAVPDASGGLPVTGNRLTAIPVVAHVSLVDTSTALGSAYDPAKTASQAGDAMALTSGERTTLTAAIWAALTSGLTVVGSIGKRLADDIDATISGRSSHSAADVWAVATRLLTAGTNIVLAKGTGVTGFNDLSAAQVNAEADTALADYDGPTHAEMTAELATADDATLAAIAGLSIPTAAANAAAVQAVTLTEGYAADGAAPTLQQAIFEILQFLEERSISGTTLTVKKRDGSTTAMTFTLDDATTPTSQTRAT